MSVNSPRLPLIKAIINAKIANKPLVIVEGKDDLPVYHSLLNNGKNQFTVKPIEFFNDCSSGCKEIERKIGEINYTYPTGHDIYNHFKGIADLDTKIFRKSKTNMNGLLYLKTYSFENCFVTKKSILYCVKLLTSVTDEQLTMSVANKALQEINNNKLEFYYITLEALKNAVVEKYDGLVGFSDGYERFLYDPQMKELMLNKRAELDVFAQEHEINSGCILQMSDYCKGKWHLRFFISETQKAISKLNASCGVEIPICPFCEIGEKDKCLYKQTNKIETEHISKALKANLDNADIEYIRDELMNISKAQA